jgi:hypothetical protein
VRGGAGLSTFSARVDDGTLVHDVAMRSAFGVGVDRFESRWADWVEESL